MRRKGFAAALMILGTGCAFEPAEHPDPARVVADDEAPPWQIDDGIDQRDRATMFSMRTDSAAVVARVGDADITGGEINLGRFAEDASVAVRGRAFGRMVNLDTTAGRITGILGGHPVDLAVARHDGAIHVDGLTRGGPSSFVISTRSMRGHIGRCAYDLARGANGYTGRRSCGGPSEQVLLRIPPLLACWSDEARIAAIAVLMGS